MSAAGIQYPRRYIVDGDGEELALELIQGPDEELARLGETFSGLDPSASYQVSAAELAGYYSAIEPGAPRFKIKLDNMTAGILGLRLAWLRGPYLQYLAVVPRFQKRRIATRLLAWFEHEARARGNRNIWICVSAFNDGAARLYRRHGFEVAAELEGLIADPHVELLMRKQLDR